MKIISEGRAAALWAVLALLTACGGDTQSAVPSNWYPASDIYAYMKAVQDESGTVTTTAELRNGGASDAAYIYLSSGERLYSALDVPPRKYLEMDGDLFPNSQALSEHLKVMAERRIVTDYSLFTQSFTDEREYFTFDTPHTGATPVRAYVDFERAGNVLTGESSVDLPSSFQIQTPAANTTVSRTGALVLAWTNVDASTTMELDVAGSCQDGSRFTAHLNLGTDTGSASLNGADYFPSTINASQTCRMAFLLQRVKDGSVSSQFAFGMFKGVQQRVVQFTSVP